MSAQQQRSNTNPPVLQALASAAAPMLAVFLLAGCGEGGASSTGVSTAAPPTVSVVTPAPAKSSGSTGTQPAVATVSESPISYKEFAQQYARALSQGSRLNPDPPTYTKCVAEVQATKPPTQTTPSPAVTHLIEERDRASCKEIQNEYTQGAMDTLIRRKWSSEAAQKAGVSVSKTEVQKAANEQLDEGAENLKRREQQATGAQGSEGAEGPESLAEAKREVRELRLQKAGKGPAAKSAERLLAGREKLLAKRESTQASSDATDRQRYLSENNLTMADLEAEVTGRLLFDKLRPKANSSAAANTTKVEDEQQSFEQKFTEEWTAKTSCAQGFVIGLCGNASQSMKRKELPRKSTDSAPVSESQSIPAGPTQVIKVSVDRSGTEKYTTPTSITAHAGKFKFVFENPSQVPDSFAVERGNEEGPLSFFEEFAQTTKSMKMELHAGAYKVTAFGRSGPSVTLTVR